MRRVVIEVNVREDKDLLAVLGRIIEDVASNGLEHADEENDLFDYETGFYHMEVEDVEPGQPTGWTTE